MTTDNDMLSGGNRLAGPCTGESALPAIPGTGVGGDGSATPDTSFHSEPSPGARAAQVSQTTTHAQTQRAQTGKGANARTCFDDMPAPQQAGILCNDPRFQRFAAMRCGLPDKRFSVTATAQFLRDCCRISSRKSLGVNPDARDRFSRLRTEFDAWTGRIAAQR